MSDVEMQNQVESLTERERDVLSLLAEERTNQQIAEELVLSLNTVKWYARQIYAKLGVSNRRQAVRQAQALGLLGAEQGESLPKHNLPAQLTAFVGRRREIVEITELLSDPTVRLITILGSGGMGKTRLSLTVAERQLYQRRFPHGIYFVPLAGLTKSGQIAPAIAKAMKLRLEQGESQLLNHLRAKQILVLLDNFEHLLEGSELVVRLLQGAPELQFLVTSRERLQLQGEQLYPIKGLSVDIATHVNEGVAINDAGALDDASMFFLQVMRRLRPSVQIMSENLPALHKICRLVDGTPLALELAAAWVDSFTLPEIAAEIERNLGFLATDLRNIPARHRSMEAVFDASWQQLPTRLQQVLAALSVFRGGFTREAAAVVSQISVQELTALVNKSLLFVEPDTRRYRIHELVRQYASERLADGDVPRRHRAYYLDWLIQQAPKLSGVEQDRTTAQIETELDNIRAASDQALRSGELEDFQLVMHCLAQFYDTQCRHQEGMSLFDHLRTRLEATPNPNSLNLFWAIAWQVRALGALGHFERAQELWRQGRALLEGLVAQHSDTRAERAISHSIDGFELFAKDPISARRLFEHSYDLAMDLGEFRLAGIALEGLALSARNQGDLAAAASAAAEKLSLARKWHDRRSIVWAQLQLGNLAGLDGRYTLAERQLLAGIEAARRDRPPLIAYGLNKLQMVYLHTGRFKDAEGLLNEDLRLSEEASFTWGIVRNRVSLALLQLHRGRYLEARAEGESALSLAREHGLSLHVCEALAILAQVEIAEGNYEAAKEKLWESDRLCQSRPVGTQSYVAGNELYWAIVLVAMGRLESAMQHLQSELESAVERRDELNIANAVAGVAFLHATKSEATNPTSALELYALSRKHPFVARSHWFTCVVGEPVNATAATLAPEAASAALARGREKKLRDVTASYVLDAHSLS